MPIHRSDARYVQLFVTTYHKFNLDVVQGQEYNNQWVLFVEEMQKKGEYLPDSASQKAAKEFYKHQNPFLSNFWTSHKEQTLKSIKTWLQEQYASRKQLHDKILNANLKQKQHTSKDMSIDSNISLNIPPKIVQSQILDATNNSNNNFNVQNETNMQNSISQIVQPTIEMQPVSNNCASIASEFNTTRNSSAEPDKNVNQNNFITITRKKRKKRSKKEFDETSSDSDSEMRDFDLSFRATQPTNKGMQSTLSIRRNEEPQIQFARNQQRLQAVRANTSVIVQDLIKTTVPTIMNNETIQQIIGEERNFQKKQNKFNKMVLQQLKVFKEATEQYFGILDDKLETLLRKNDIRTARPPKRKRTDINLSSDEEFY